MKSGVVTKYYFAGATRIAVRTNGTLSYLLGDHLGSSSVTTDANGVKTASALYKAFGETRYTSGALGTDYKFTGQREEASLGLYFYGARWYDGSLGRFTSADTMIPTQTQGTQAWDRYAYVNNNPVRYTDPTGHMCEDPEAGDECDGANNHEQSLEKPPVEQELSLEKAAYVLEVLAGGDILLYRAWLSLYRSNEGRYLAQNILTDNVKMGWTDIAGSKAECTSEAGCVINLDPELKEQDYNNLVAELGHEAYHHQYGDAWDQSTNSQLEEFRAFQAEDRIYQELTGTPRYIFEGFNTSPESMVDWFKNNDYGLPQYLNLQPYPPTNFYLP